MWLRKKEDSSLGAGATSIPGWTQLHAKVTRDAIVAALFLRRYNENVLPQYRDKTGIVTAHYIEAFIHEEMENKRFGAVKLRLGPLVEEPRGSLGGHIMPQFHSGKQLRADIVATDIDGNPVDASGATATTDNPGQLVVSVEGSQLVVADSPGPGLGSGNVTVSVGGASVTEAFEVIAGDAVAVNLGAFTEEDRPA